jgi:hypothetical protein
VEVGLVVAIVLALYYLRGGESQDVRVFLPCLKDRHQTLYFCFQDLNFRLFCFVLLLDILYLAINLNCKFLLQFFNLIQRISSIAPDLVHLKTAPQLQLAYLIHLIPRNFAPQLQIQRYEVFVLLADDFLITRHLVQLVEITDLVGQSLCKQFVVVFRGGNVLWEESVVFESCLDIVGVVPIMLTFVLHDLEYSTSVDLAYVLVM